MGNNEIEEQCTSTQNCVQEQQCTTETKTVADTTYVDECTDVVTQVCNDVTQVSSVPVASYAAAPVVASSVGVATSPHALSSAPIASAALATPALVSSPSAVALASSQLYRGKRDADAEADPQYLISGALRSITPSAIVKTMPVCTPVTTQQCNKVPKTIQRSVA